MNHSVGQAIEKIKLQEQDNETKLRDKRDLNNTVLTLNRRIRDGLTYLQKLSKEYKCLTLSIDKLVNQLIIEKTRNDALVDQVNKCNKELEDLRDSTNNGVYTVWKKRSKLLDAIRDIANKCDIWALLIKPTCDEIIPNIYHVQQNDEPFQSGIKLKNAIKRRNEAIAERNHLFSEPETGEEFIRIKNALQYSIEIAANVIQE